MNKPLTIAMLSIHSCPLGRLGGRDTGGMNVYVREVAKELGRRGHTVDIFTKSHQQHHEQYIDLDHNVKLIHLDTANEMEMPKIAIYASLQDITCGIENFRKNNARRYDLIHSHYWLSGMAGQQIQTLWHIPHMIMFHTLGIPKNTRSPQEDEPELRIESEKELISGCDRIIAATERERDALLTLYGASSQRVAVIPCGVNMELFKPIDKMTARRTLQLNNDKIILFVGRFEHLKGLRQLLKAMTFLPGDNASRLIIVGGDEHSYEELQELQTMVRELHIEDRAFFVGSVDQEKLPLYYSAADICVIPSYYESFGMVALESLACGTPVVAGDVGGMRQIIRHEAMGYITPSNAPELLAERISHVLQREKLGVSPADMRSAIARFAWPNITKQITAEYEAMFKAVSVAPSD